MAYSHEYGGISAVGWLEYPKCKRGSCCSLSGVRVAPNDVLIEINPKEYRDNIPERFEGTIIPAAEALKKQLVERGIQVPLAIRLMEKCPPKTIKIRIGLRTKFHSIIKRLERDIESETNELRKEGFIRARDAYKELQRRAGR